MPLTVLLTAAEMLFLAAALTAGSVMEQDLALTGLYALLEFPLRHRVACHAAYPTS